MTEHSDINDSWILGSTTQETNDKGQVKYRINLPSGRPLESGWVAQDMAKNAVHAWLSAVRDQVSADAQAKTDEAKEIYLRKKRDEAMNASSPVAQPSAEPARRSAVLSSDPVEYAKQMVDLLTVEHKHWVESCLDSTMKRRSCELNLLRWQTILESLTKGDDSAPTE